ncbi:MAG: hypothetical protein IKR97_07750 [Eubacterium sp.]|nr:hypothetical protein [Eubacterium sp.]
MKYVLRVFIVLILAVGVVFGVFRYTNPEAFNQSGDSGLTTVTKPAATEKNSNRVLLSSIEKEGFYLYKGSKGVLLKHGDNEFTYTNWSALIDAETPEMRWADFNGDGKKELLIKAVSEKMQDGSFIYEIYILTPTKTDSGEENFDVAYASRNTWSSILDNHIVEEMRQLKSCKKIIQFAMNAKGKSINYDKETGIAKSGYVGYARALQNKNGEYMTVSKWNKGSGIYSVSKDNKISISVDIDINYKNSDKVQRLGVIYFELFLNEKNVFQVTEKSMVFKPSKEYKVSNPKKVAEVPWDYTENNSNTSSASNNIIQWIKYSTEYSPDNYTQTKDFSSSLSDINKIKTIKLHDSYIELIAKKDCTFDGSSMKSGDYSVIINDKLDISYTCEIKTDEKSQKLIITFDKSYPQTEIKSITVNYGTK